MRLILFVSFLFFPSSPRERPVPSGILPAFYRTTRRPPSTPLWDPLAGCLYRCCRGCCRFWSPAEKPTERTDSRCLPRQRDWNLFIALADRHSRALIGGTNQVRSLEERRNVASGRSSQPTHANSHSLSLSLSLSFFLSFSLRAAAVIILICGETLNTGEKYGWAL